MLLEDITGRADELIKLANKTFAESVASNYKDIAPDIFSNLRSGSLSFIERVYGIEHTYYKEFDKQVTDISWYNIKLALGILTAIRNELDGGWLQTTRGLISAEVFADFLEMAEHLLDEHYKDAAAVMIGGVLEEHLRQLCQKAALDVEDFSNGKSVPRKADRLNSQLSSTKIYTKLDQKQVTAWLDLRNKAAHARYGEYSEEQVKLMLDGVRNFITRNSL
ncbi:hypothetical protein [Microseira sp. BLCC-F43]|jgi:hypothetical protein|uniref:hypothetical protein n=1 Tax=Microseira sp. BLCC-F43 TaxID=3153602 RepID=UPI0035B76201